MSESRRDRMRDWIGRHSIAMAVVGVLLVGAPPILEVLRNPSIRSLGIASAAVVTGAFAGFMFSFMVRHSDH